MRKRPSKTHKHPLTPAKAHERALKAWRTKHLRYRYGGILRAHRVEFEGDQFDDERTEDPSLDTDDKEVKEEKTWRDRMRTKRERYDKHEEAYDEVKAGELPDKREGPKRVIPTHKDWEEHERLYDDLAYDVDSDHEEWVVYRGTENREVVVKHDTKRLDGPAFKEAEAYRRAVEQKRREEWERDADRQRMIGYAKKDKSKKLKEQQMGQVDRRKRLGHIRAQNEEVREQLQRKRKHYQEGHFERNFKTHTPYGGLGGPTSTSDRRGDLGISSAEERVVRLKQWELINDKDKKIQDKLVFTLGSEVAPVDAMDPNAVHPRGFERYNEDTGDIEIYSDDMKTILSDAGIRNARIRRTGGEGDYSYEVIAEEGRRISPAHAALVQKELQREYGVKNFNREGADMQPKRIVLKPGEQLPASIDPSDVKKVRRDTGQVEPRYVVQPDGTIAHNPKAGQPIIEETPWTAKNRLDENRVKTDLGTRKLVKDDHTGAITGFGELEEGNADTIRMKMRLPGAKRDSQLYWNVQERSDSIGFGTDWKPGEKEVNDLLFSGARWNYLADVAEATAKATAEADAGDYKDLDKLIQKMHPDADTEEEIQHWRKEMMDLGNAGIATTAYSLRAAARTRGVHGAVKRIPLVGDKVYAKATKYHVLPTLEHAYIRPLGQKLDRALWRVHHPLSDPNMPQLSRFEGGLIPDAPTIRYRHKFVSVPKTYRGEDSSDWTIEKYQRERRLNAQTLELAHARDRIHRAMEDKSTKRGAKAHRYAVLHSTKGVLEKSERIKFKDRWDKLVATETDPKQLAKMTKLEVGVNQHELANIIHNNKIKGPDGGHLKMAGKAGLYGVAGVAVIGASVYGYDKYKERQLDKGKDSDKRLRDHIPEVITIPRADWYSNKNYKIPTNTWTDALDIEGRDVPYSWRVRNDPKKIRLRNHKDISNEGYKSAPILGSVKFGGGTKNDGSWTNSIAYKQREEGAGRYMEKQGSVKNKYEMKVAGKNVPFYAQIGDKERWDKGDLKSGNPNKLTQEDREKIAVAIMYEGKNSPLGYRYGDDEAIMEILNDPEKSLAVERKHNNVHSWNRSTNRRIVKRDPVTGEYYYEDELGLRNPLLGRSQDEIDRGVPLRDAGGAFFDSPEEVKFKQEEYDAQVRREQRAFHETLGMTGEDVESERYQRRSGPIPGVDATDQERYDRRRYE